MPVQNLSINTLLKYFHMKKALCLHILNFRQDFLCHAHFLRFIKELYLKFIIVGLVMFANYLMFPMNFKDSSKIYFVFFRLNFTTWHYLKLYALLILKHIFNHYFFMFQNSLGHSISPIVESCLIHNALTTGPSSIL